MYPENTSLVGIDPQLCEREKITNLRESPGAPGESLHGDVRSKILKIGKTRLAWRTYQKQKIHNKVQSTKLKETDPADPATMDSKNSLSQEASVSRSRRTGSPDGEPTSASVKIVTASSERRARPGGPASMASMGSSLWVMQMAKAVGFRV